MNIFIGSSSKNKPSARRIATALEGAGFDVLRWWDSFGPGDVTIERLIEMSDACDGAVFVFGADDEIIKDTGRGSKKLVATRDNVLLEYGMFVGKVGVKKTLFVRQADVEIPTDLHGITYVGEADYIDKIVRALRRALGDAAPSQIASRIMIYASRKLLQKAMNETPVPNGWFSRALYIGSRGARAWQAIEKDANYSGHQDFVSVRKLIEEQVKKARLPGVASVISFGPGMGLLDKEILPILSQYELVEYVAVDISDYLAVSAADSLTSASHKTHAPFVIIADFEDDMRVIAEIIEERTRPGRAFIMMGGTFGNLENGEDQFLNGLHGAMHEKDFAILDVITYKESYSVQKDAYRDLRALPESIKNFLAGGIERRFGTPINAIVEDIEDHIEFRTDNPTSQIQGTREFVFSTKRGKCPLLYIRRYNFGEFKSHLQKRGFRVLSSGKTSTAKNQIDRAVYIITKK